MNDKRRGSTSGDFNTDDKIDAAADVAWRKRLGNTYSQTDYTTWRAHFGQAVGSGSDNNAITSVPEPAMMVMLITTAPGVSTQWRWRTSRVSQLNNV